MMADDLTRAAADVLEKLRTSDPAGQNTILTRLDGKIFEAYVEGDTDKLRTLQDIRRRAGVAHTRHLDANGRVLYETRGGGIEIVRDSVPHLPFGRLADNTSGTQTLAPTRPRAAATVTKAPPPESVDLRANAKPKITLKISQRVWDELRERASESRDGRETGGFLFGEQPKSWKTEVRANEAVSLVTARSRTSARLDIDTAISMRRTREKWAPDTSYEIAVWHTHPRPQHYDDRHLIGLPSKPDMRTWLSALDHLEQPYYLGVILTSDDPDEQRWMKPHVAVWVVRREPHSGTPVCEPGLFEVLGTSSQRRKGDNRHAHARRR